MALPKLDNTQIEKNQQTIIKKLDDMYSVLNSKIYERMMVKDENATLTKMFPFIVQIADNVYNIAAKLNAGVTSLKEVQSVLAATKPDEGAQIEQKREQAAAAKATPESKEKKTMSFWERLGSYLEKVLVPLVFGLIVGLSKALGGFETTLGKILTIFTALYISLKSFRTAINSFVIGLFKQLPELIGFIRESVISIGKGIINAGKLLQSGITNAFTKVMGFISRIVPAISESYSKAGKLITNTFREIVILSSNIAQKASSAFETMRAFFSKVSSIVSNKLVKAADIVVDSFKTIYNVIAGIGKAGNFAGKIASGVTKVIEFFGKFGKLLGPIGVAISTITALFSAVQGAFEGFDEEGVYGAVKGFTAGLITGLVGWLGDLGTWITSKLLGLLGLDELSAKVAEFDFSGTLNNLIKQLFDIVASPFDSLGKALAAVMNFDFASLAKKLLLVLAPPDSIQGKILGTGKLEQEIRASEAASKQAVTAKQTLPQPATVAPPKAAGAKPVIAPVARQVPGGVISGESQRVAQTATQPRPVSGQTNIVAPQQSIVNASQSQTVNAPLSAYGIFGGRVSQSPAFSANF